MTYSGFRFCELRFMLDTLYLGLLIDVRLSGYIRVYFEYMNKIRHWPQHISRRR
jgi:hypothetical protein